MSKSNIQFPAWPFVENDEKEAVLNVLNSGKLNYWSGQECKSFEKEFSEKFNIKHSIAASNGTIALELALRACGVGAGDEVIVTPRTFVATATAVMMCGAKPVFADVEYESGNISTRTIETVISDKTKAVIPVHMGGLSCEMDKICDLAKSKNLFVIEDCAQAIGAKIDDRYAGSWADIGAFSFCQDKIITTGGEGGLITTNNSELWDKLWSLKEHGKSYDTVFNKKRTPGFAWLHERVGTNGRMTEMQAAIGRKALAKLDGWINQRRKNAEYYNKRFENLKGIFIPPVPSNYYHVYYRHHVYVEPESLNSGWNRDRIINELSALGLPAFSGTCCEIYLEKTFKDNGLAPINPLPNAAKLTQNSLMFQVHHRLSENHLEVIADALENILKSAVA